MTFQRVASLWGGGFGWNTTINKWRYTGKSRGLLLNFNGFVGYNFNMYSGAKLMVDYVANPIWQKNGSGNFYKFTYKTHSYLPTISSMYSTL